MSELRNPWDTCGNCGHLREDHRHTGECFVACNCTEFAEPLVKLASDPRQWRGWIASSEPEDE